MSGLTVPRTRMVSLVVGCMRCDNTSSCAVRLSSSAILSSPRLPALEARLMCDGVARPPRLSPLGASTGGNPAGAGLLSPAVRAETRRLNPRDASALAPILKNMGRNLVCGPRKVKPQPSALKQQG